MGKSVSKILGVVVIVLVVILAGIQLIRPSVTNHNPPVVQEPAWPSPRVRELAQRACFDCHSNETVWPWYSQIAPVSWLVANDVVGGRDAFNFSDWGAGHPGADQFGEEIAEGGMPLPIYLIMHPSARFSEAEKQELISGLAALR
jgi:cytochrome c551/c552